MSHTSARGDIFAANVEREPRVCFEIDEPGEVFDYGRFECDSGLAYRSVILFGNIRIAEDAGDQSNVFCEALMAKYGKPDTDRPKGFFPRLDIITVYAIAVERMTGKERRCPRCRAVAGERPDQNARRAALRDAAAALAPQQCFATDLFPAVRACGPAIRLSAPGSGSSSEWR